VIISKLQFWRGGEGVECYKIDNCDSCIFDSIGIFEASEEWLHNQRISENFEIIICIKGPVFIQVGEKQYVLERNDVLIIPAFTRHFGYRKSSAQTSFYWLHFYPNSPIQECNLSEKFASNSDNSNIILPVYSKNMRLSQVIIIINLLLDIMNRSSINRAYAQQLFKALLLEFTRQMKDLVIDEVKDHERRQSISLIKKWIEHNYYREITVEEIAEKFNYNPDYLSHVFKHRYCVTITELIQKKRIEYAKELLTNSLLRVSEIAYTCGYSNPKYFSSVFKHYEHLSPTDFRKAYQNTHINND
jgi:YesN/AraC family two-component response regulator